MNGERPCFISHGQEREFEALVTYAICGIYACGEDHAFGAIGAVVPLSHDVSAIIRCAKADIANSRPKQILADLERAPGALG